MQRRELVQGREGRASRWGRGKGDGLWVCVLKSSGLGQQEFLKVHMGWTAPHSFFCLPRLPSKVSKDLGQKLQVSSKQGHQEIGEVEFGTSIEVGWEEAIQSPKLGEPEENVI